MQEVPSYMESTGGDSVNTLLHPPDTSDRDEPAFTQLVPSSSDAVRALVVTIEESVEEWLSSNRDVEEQVKELVVVSVGDGVRSTTAAQPGTPSAPTLDPLPGEPIIEFVPEAGNLTELGQTINAHLSGAPTPTNEQPHTILYLDSLAALLDASDTETVFRFLHMMTSLVNAQGATAYYQLDSSQVDSETVLILSALFDSNLED